MSAFRVIDSNLFCCPGEIHLIIQTFYFFSDLEFYPLVFAGVTALLVSLMTIKFVVVLSQMKKRSLDYSGARIYHRTLFIFHEPLDLRFRVHNFFSCLSSMVMFVKPLLHI